MKKPVEITIEDLKLRTVIGCNKWERSTLQEVSVTVSYKYNASKAIELDDIEFAADYYTLTEEIKKSVEESQFHLIEAMSDMIFLIVSKNPFAYDICVQVSKPGAIKFASNVKVKYLGVDKNR